MMMTLRGATLATYLLALALIGFGFFGATSGGQQTTFIAIGVILMGLGAVSSANVKKGGDTDAS